MFAQYRALCKSMNGYYSNKGELLGDIQAGECCMVQPVVGGDWQRAEVLGRSDGMLQVYLVDTGAILEIDDIQSRELM